METVKNQRDSRGQSGAVKDRHSGIVRPLCIFLRPILKSTGVERDQTALRGLRPSRNWMGRWASWRRGSFGTRARGGIVCRERTAPKISGRHTRETPMAGIRRDNLRRPPAARRVARVGRVTAGHLVQGSPTDPIAQRFTGKGASAAFSRAEDQDSRIHCRNAG